MIDLDAQVSVIKAMIELAARRGDVTYAARQMFEYFVVGIVPRPVADNKIDLIADFSFFRKEWPEDVVPAFVRLLLFDHAREKAVLEPLSADEIVTLRDAETQLATYYAIHLLGEMRGKYWNLAMTKGEHGQPIASLQDWGNEYGK